MVQRSFQVYKTICIIMLRLYQPFKLILSSVQWSFAKATWHVITRLLWLKMKHVFVYYCFKNVSVLISSKVNIDKSLWDQLSRFFKSKNFENCCSMFSMLWNLRSAFWLSTWSILVNVLCALKKNVYNLQFLDALQCVCTWNHACILEV